MEGTIPAAVQVRWKRRSESVGSEGSPASAGPFETDVADEKGWRGTPHGRLETRGPQGSRLGRIDTLRLPRSGADRAEKRNSQRAITLVQISFRRKILLQRETRGEEGEGEKARRHRFTSCPTEKSRPPARRGAGLLFLLRLSPTAGKRTGGNRRKNSPKKSQKGNERDEWLTC